MRRQGDEALNPPPVASSQVTNPPQCGKTATHPYSAESEIP